MGKLPAEVGKEQGAVLSLFTNSRHSQLLETVGHGNGELGLMGFFVTSFIFSYLVEIPFCKYDTGRAREDHGGNPRGVCLCLYFPFVVPLTAMEKAAGTNVFLGVCEGGCGAEVFYTGLHVAPRRKLFLDKFSSIWIGKAALGKGGSGYDGRHDMARRVYAKI